MIQKKKNPEITEFKIPVHIRQKKKKLPHTKEFIVKNSDQPSPIQKSYCDFRSHKMPSFYSMRGLGYSFGNNPYNYEVLNKNKEISRERNIIPRKQQKRDLFRYFLKKRKEKRENTVTAFFKKEQNIYLIDKIKPSIMLVCMMVVAVVMIGIAQFTHTGFSVKKEVFASSLSGLEDLKTAGLLIERQDFKTATHKLKEAQNEFENASREFEKIGSVSIVLSKYIPFASKLSSGYSIVEISKNITSVAQSLNESLEVISSLKHDQNKQINTLELFQILGKNLQTVTIKLTDIEKDLDNVAITDIPEEYRNKIILLKSLVPEAKNAAEELLQNSNILVDILGGNGPRKYLFLFQNNHEMRATGGFIGSYGRLDMRYGEVSHFFIDGIFNPDGQLIERIIPPKPIQKISAAWSLHDSNWFPDFPKSAEKGILFYEKTGGPTVDGVIAITPEVLEKILNITGPIDLPEYNLVLNAENFMEETQYKVEIDYDQVENKPKKILGDLAEKIIEKLKNTSDIQTVLSIIDAVIDSFEQKHILVYSRSQEMQDLIEKQGWGGNIINTEKDYLSVINTNINGYKTDGVIDETISHEINVQDNGEIIDTVTIERKHNGGMAKREWWNQVNADYMRVYVPEGSELLDVKGQTREFVSPPIDYEAQYFKDDRDILYEEENMVINYETGTRIYTENDKTVFANWVYVSPQETVRITYTYKLPYRLKINEKSIADSISVAYQKQSGSKGSTLVTTLTLPKGYETVWQFNPKNEILEKDGIIKQTSLLSADIFFGVVVKKQGR